MMGMMFWMVLFWVVLIGGGIWLIVSMAGRSADGGRRRYWMLAGGAALLVLFALVPAVMMAGNAWDMADMHGRGQNTSGDGLVQGGMSSEVRIEDFAFSPGNLEVPVGATVTWANKDSAQHDATARNDDWHTKQLSDGESDTLTFGSAVEYEYYCSIHPSMKAKLMVR